jgi:hypothetical protein
MELLHSNLLQEIQNRSTGSSGMALDDIRKISLQLLICLVYLEKLNIIHAGNYTFCVDIYIQI